MWTNHLQLRYGVFCAVFSSLEHQNIWIRNGNEVKSTKVQFAALVLSGTAHEIKTGQTVQMDVGLAAFRSEIQTCWKNINCLLDTKA